MSDVALFVDDDQVLTNYIKTYALKRSMLVEVASSIKEALLKIKQKNYALAILDRILPDGDGLSILDQLDMQKTAVIISSSKHLLSDRLLGLSRGSLDYICKPFCAIEIYLKIKNHLINKGTNLNKIIQLKDVTLNLETGNINILGVNFHLTYREAMLMRVLVSSANKTVERDRLINEAWVDSRNYPQNSSLDVYLRRLRMKISPFGKQLETIRQFGYRFNCLNLEKV